VLLLKFFFKYEFVALLFSYLLRFIISDLLRTRDTMSVPGTYVHVGLRIICRFLFWISALF